MPSPKKGVSFTFTASLIDTSNRPFFRSNPTLATGDVQVSKDNGTFANITTLPTVSPTSSRLVLVSLSATEMDADRVDVQFVDASGNEWDSVIYSIQTTTVTVDDLVRSTTPANTLSVNASNTIDLTSTERNAISDALLARSLGSESYASDGSVPTVAQMMFMIYSAIAQFDVSSVTLTTRRLDGTTSAMVFTLDDANNPTSRVRTG